MLASEFVLLLFIGVWIWGQYELQETHMDKDLQLAFDKSYEKLTNNILDIRVDSILHDNAAKKPVAFHIKMDGNLNSKDTIAAFRMQPSGNFTKTVIIKSPAVQGIKTTRTDSYFIKNFNEGAAFSDTGAPVPPDVKKMLRVVLNQSLGNIIVKTRVDSILLKKEFLNSVHKNYQGLDARWIEDSAHHKFKYRPANLEKEALQVNGYKHYLFIAILPQIGFTIFISGLTGIAFWMAYRNMKRQLRFATQKDSFISNISHELKTPVATTKVALEALSTYHAIDDPERTKRYLKVAMLEMDRLAALINRVLNTLQTEDGLLHLELESLNLFELIKEVAETLSPILQENKIAFTLEVMQHDIFVKADRVHLTGVFYNLIDNAVKYGSGIVKISVDEKDDWVTVNIMNNGNRIDAEYRDKVFEKFFRIPHGNRHTVKGHGLGLSYAQYIVRAHGGNINLESKVDETVFSVTLPKS
ncbi:HAMP domain-containing histidine kinase [Taibaiella lutea]|uniref:histidine kinase n=1 Tax=Taibaiella lutea TaxID=2608001 RepID=A0A5M6CH15_9BACT|nr:HAMP domain-containing sensor histidine kinase [Taibaiella lutea]KAA5532705.1 HAMP domain-containing histidine kinase [Taibaiella lutea]